MLNRMLQPETVEGPNGSTAALEAVYRAFDCSAAGWEHAPSAKRWLYLQSISVEGSVKLSALALYKAGRPIRLRLREELPTSRPYGPFRPTGSLRARPSF